MPSYIKKGESIFIPFKDSVSVYDSQHRPRMYKTPQAFERSFPGRAVDKDFVELVEYAEVYHASWDPMVWSDNKRLCGYKCSRCGHIAAKKYNYCYCGAKMLNSYSSSQT